MSKIAIVGGGIAGLSAGFRLAKEGNEVYLWEAGRKLGGLATTIKIAGTLLEGAYHHIFKNDFWIMDTIKKAGLMDKLIWRPTPMGFFSKGKIWHFGTPIDLIKYKPLSFKDRIKFGLSILYFQRLKNWRKLEDVTVKEWVEKYCSSNVYEEIWKPLLRLKFGNYYQNISAAWLWGRINPRSKSRSKGGFKEELGYMKGSFQVLFDKLAEKIESYGGKVFIKSPVRKVEMVKNKYRIVTATGIEENFDQVLLTVPSPLIQKIVPDLPENYLKEWKKFKYLGAICLILALKKPLSDIYWLNISDNKINFGGVIEQTNFIPPENYNNLNIVYFFNYLKGGHPYFKLKPDELLNEYIPSIKKIFPHFNKDLIVEIKKFMVRFATPVYFLGYSRVKMPNHTPWRGLYIANITQIYPEDRNMSNAIAVAHKAVDLMLKESSTGK